MRRCQVNGKVRPPFDVHAKNSTVRHQAPAVSLAFIEFSRKRLQPRSFLSAGETRRTRPPDARDGIVCRMDQNAEAMYYDRFPGFCRKATGGVGDKAKRKNPFLLDIRRRELDPVPLQTHRYCSFAYVCSSREVETTSDVSVTFSPPINLTNVDWILIFFREVWYRLFSSRDKNLVSL